MLLLVYTQAGLFHELRREVDAMITSTVGKNGSIGKLHVTSLRTVCPLLTSISRGFLVRQITEGIVRDGRRLSRKDGMIKTLYPVVHNDILDWGLDVDESNARRFDILGKSLIHNWPGKWVVQSLKISAPHL